MLKVKELINKLKEVDQEAYVVFDDDQKYKYPILDIIESYIDCNDCFNSKHINDYVPCAEVNNNFVQDYTDFCKKHTIKNIIVLTTDYQKSADSVKLLIK